MQLDESRKEELIRSLEGRRTPQLRPQFEAIILAQKPREGTFVANWEKWRTGLIDADYQGPLLISAWNRGSADFTIEPGDRIAQLLLLPIVRASLQVVDTFEHSDRGSGGFGHTGTR